MNSQRLDCKIPDALAPFAEPVLIEGEHSADFEALRALLIEDIEPQSNVEWLWLFDIAELAWEVLRYRKLKARVISMYRAKAIESLLFRLDEPSDVPQFQLYAKRSAADWRSDAGAAAEIESRLARAGFDTNAMNAEVIVQAHEAVALFDRLIHTAQTRRNVLLREISISRSFGRPSTAAHGYAHGRQLRMANGRGNLRQPR